MLAKSIIPLLLLTLALAPTAHAADDVAAKVNAQIVKRSWQDLIVKDALAEGNKADERMVLDSLIRNELLAQEAVRLGIDRQPDFTTREEMRRKELLANLLIRDELRRNPITDDALKAEYERFKVLLGDKEYSARQIQVKTEAEAKDVIAQLAKGGDFAKLAQEKSVDTNTREKGGQLAWFTKNSITPPLGEAASKLQKGLFTTVPMQTQFGWHVLKLEDVRSFTPPPFEQVKERMRQNLKSQQIQKLMNGLRTKASIEIQK